MFWVPFLSMQAWLACWLATLQYKASCHSGIKGECYDKVWYISGNYFKMTANYPVLIFFLS